MREVFARRGEVDAARELFEKARAAADTHEAELRLLRGEIEAKRFTAPHPHVPASWQELKEEEQAVLSARAEERDEELSRKKAELRAKLDVAKPMFGEDNTAPIALLPVRLETRFADAATIQVRVYPDDIHAEGFDLRLTRGELRAAREYWAKPDAVSWQRLLDRFGPARAAWATRATRAGAPEPKLRKADERPPSQISTLPTRWRFLGLVGGDVVIDKSGLEIPLPLPVGIVLREGEAGKSDQADWLIEFDAAVKIGMAVTLRLPEGVGHLDQLFVFGVQRGTPAEGAQRLRDTLRGHAFGAGLGFLAPGTPTNNTPESRSAWSSRPRPQAPEAEAPKLAPGTDAERLADGLGLPKANFLAECQGGGASGEAPLAAITLLSWGALSWGAIDAAQLVDLETGGTRPLDFIPWLELRDHLAGYVRGRGPLPTIRVGNQPYGILPVTSVDEWRPTVEERPTGRVADWIVRLRPHWRAALAPGWIPRVTDGAEADRTAVEVLSRLPVAIDLAVRRLTAHEISGAKKPAEWPGPPLGVAEVPVGSSLRWTLPTEMISTLSYDEETHARNYGRVAANLDPDPGLTAELIAATRDQYADALTVARGKLTIPEYTERWPLPDQGPRRPTLFSRGEHEQQPGLVEAMLELEEWPGWDEGEAPAADPFRQALALPAVIDELAAIQLAEAGPGDEVVAGLRTALREGKEEGPRVLAALRALASTPPEQLSSLALEVIDVYSHRLDAWITSLASRRLDGLREGKGAAATRIGGYGWVENLHPAPGGADVDGYVHAPSLHQAATAAVLRSGFRAHGGKESLAVNLNSRRARIARWLLGGVRRGQELGSLLGYRFERALHDNGLDRLIADFRGRYPARMTAEPEDGAQQPGLWERSTEAIAARNVVDGLALARDAGSGERDFGEATPFVADLLGALDAVGDLVLAESVHQLIGGNPMRAGLAADTLGRGEDVPDRFDILRTPQRGRAITHRVAAVLPPHPGPAGGWAEDALAKLEPRVEAWVADALGPASGRRLTGTIGADGGERRFDRGAEELGFGALRTALQVSSANRSELDARIRELEGVAGAAAVSYDGPDWQALRGVATRICSLLSAAQPLLPGHLAAGEAAAKIEVDGGELRGRLTAFVATLSGTERPEDDPPTPASRLAELVGEEPGQGWLAAVTAALAEVLGAAVPLTPLLVGAGLGEAPAKSGAPELADWARGVGAVRPAVRTWHELLMLVGASSGRACPLVASQSPLDDAKEAWLGGRFEPTARPAASQQVVCHTPLPLPAGGPLAGFVFDEWAEVLPGSDALAATKLEGKDPVPAESALTGLSFHFDRPDAKAPQAVLIAVPPNTKRGWTDVGLALVVHDTLELAKLRAADLGDLPLLDGLLPAVRLQRESRLGLLALNYWERLAD